MTEETTLTITAREEEELRKIGYRLRELRNQKGLNLRDLAEMTGLSSSYLSQLENGKAVPSLKAMLKLSTTFNKNLHYFFESRETEQQYIHVPFENQLIIGGDSGQRKIRILTPGERLEIEPMHVTLEPDTKSESGMTTHEGWEFLYVLEGEVTLHLGEQLIRCKTGDSICYNAMIPHFSENSGPAQAVGIWIGFKRNGS